MILSKIIAEELLKNKPADVKRPDFSKIEKLTSEGLEFLLENKVSINFPSVLEIEPEILSLFLKYSNYYFISLDGLNELNDESAEILSKINASISLNGIKAISKNVVEKLKNRQKSTSDSISLNGLKKIDEEIFDELTKIKTPVYLDGLENLTEKMAKSLIKNHNDYFSLNGLKSVDIKVVETLIKFKGYLYLNGLEIINEKVSNIFMKFQGKSLNFSKSIKLIHNKSLMIESNSDNSLSICVVKLKSKDDSTYLYAIGNSGGGTYSEFICRYTKDGSVYNLYKSNTLTYDNWDEYQQNETSILNNNLKMSKEDNHAISEILNYTKMEWLKYSENIEILPESLKLLKKNYFASKSWEEEGIKIMQIISKSWSLNYKWK